MTLNGLEGLRPVEGQVPEGVQRVCVAVLAVLLQGIDLRVVIPCGDRREKRPMVVSLLPRESARLEEERAKDLENIHFWGPGRSHKCRQ